MIQLVDDFLQSFITKQIKWLKNHPVVINQIFHTSKFETVEKIKDFLINRKVKVMIGYPRDQTSLPAYVINLAPENEQPLGLGDEYDTYDELQFGGDIDPERPILDIDKIRSDLESNGVEWTEEIEESIDSAQRALAGCLCKTGMSATYRIECWSDNGDLTSYMYAILKWCLWTCKREMLDVGWTDIRISGTDLEPAPEYMSTFVYRRSLQITLTYENLYYENVEEVEKILERLAHPEDFPDNYMDRWVAYPHYYVRD